MLLVAAASARPQTFDDFNDQLNNDLQQQMFNVRLTSSVAFRLCTLIANFLAKSPILLLLPSCC